MGTLTQKVLKRHGYSKLRGYFMESFGGEALSGFFEGNGVAFVAGFADAHLDGDLAE